jgi:hypothetical protein
MYNAPPDNFATWSAACESLARFPALKTLSIFLEFAEEETQEAPWELEKAILDELRCVKVKDKFVVTVDWKIDPSMMQSDYPFILRRIPAT